MSWSNGPKLGKWIPDPSTSQPVAAAPVATNKLASFPLDEMAWDNKPDSMGVFRMNDWQLTLGDIRAAIQQAEAAPAPTAEPIYQARGENAPRSETGKMFLRCCTKARNQKCAASSTLHQSGRPKQPSQWRAPS